MLYRIVIDRSSLPFFVDCGIARETELRDVPLSHPKEARAVEVIRVYEIVKPADAVRRPVLVRHDVDASAARLERDDEAVRNGRERSAALVAAAGHDARHGETDHRTPTSCQGHHSPRDLTGGIGIAAPAACGGPAVNASDTRSRWCELMLVNSPTRFADSISVRSRLIVCGWLPFTNCVRS